MAQIKRLAEEMGLLDNETAIKMSENDIMSLLKGNTYTFITDCGTIINLELETGE